MEIVGEKDVLIEREDLIPYGFDGTAALKKSAICVVLPRTTEAVAAVVRLAAELKMPLVTRGSGTGLSGGSVPVAGGIVLCLVHLNRILEIDPSDLTMLCETGVITKAIDDAAIPRGPFYPPDPDHEDFHDWRERREQFGWSARSQYGVTRDYVMGMEVVLPSGEVAWLGSKCVKDVAGYSMKDLFVGSEGTLGVITKVLLKLVPRPGTRRTLLASFDTMEAAARTVSKIVEKHIIPCTLEFLDRKTCASVEDYAKVGLPTAAAAVVLMETDGHRVVVEEDNRDGTDRAGERRHFRRGGRQRPTPFASRQPDVVPFPPLRGFARRRFWRMSRSRGVGLSRSSRLWKKWRDVTSFHGDFWSFRGWQCASRDPHRRDRSRGNGAGRTRPFGDF